ncbi:hypothetical protein [Priestia megaterium]|uniref:hypothetical protein n=1 Tax=Priestia megaterium TaxID=1404 RepID=UPI002E20D4D4|nr:hypothetical protein [Priestia megaterium]
MIELELNTIKAQNIQTKELTPINAIKGDKGEKGEKGEGADLDIQINGTSIVSDGVANIPIANTSTLGLVKTSVGYGTDSSSSGELQSRVFDKDIYKTKVDKTFISKGTLENIKSDVVRRALTDDTQAEWSEAEKASARQRLGVDSDINKIMELTNPIDLMVSTIADISLTNNIWMCIGIVECKPNTVTEFEWHARFTQNEKGTRYIRHSNVQANVGDTQTGNPTQLNVQGTFATPAVSKTQTGLFTKNYVSNKTDSTIKVTIWGFQDSGATLTVSSRLTTKEYIVK